ncbi:MAG: M20/M25/M40 family metallo-hydrolase [Acidobacteria bacterium]|nr:MAG: M20/M25/M40 family metallo-hydrolase [Acidobacteriota bacterium]
MPTLRRLLALTLALVTVSIAAAAQPPAGAAVLASRLSALIDKQGVSGFETDVTAAIRAMLPSSVTPAVDEMGTLTVTLGQGEPHLLVTASIDEDGYIVSDITDGGFLRLQRVSSGASHPLYDQFLYGQPVVVRRTDGQMLPAVSVSASAHLQRGRSQASAVKGLDDLWVDVGAASRAEVEKLGIKMLDTVALRERVQRLAGAQVAGLAAQARANALAMVELVRSLAAAKTLNGSVTVAWTTQGLFGDRGFVRLSRRIEPDAVIVLARAPLGRDADVSGSYGTPDKGPVVFQGGQVRSGAAAAPQAGAEATAVPQAPRLAGLPGPWAAKTKVLVLPVRFAQTPVETIQLGDLAALATLLASEAGVAPVPPDASTGPAVTGTQLGAPATGNFGTLATLIDTYGVSGHETDARVAVEKLLPKWAKPEVDAKGNLTVSFGQGGKELLFVAHTDELGYEIADIREDGMAAVRRGGVYHASMEGHGVLVHTARGRVPAIVAPRRNYTRATEWQPRAEEVLLYFGTASRAETEALGVTKGDAATVRKQLVRLGDHRASARAIDDRAGCTALIEALKKLDPAKVPNRITFAWDVEEETGLTGAGVLAERMAPAYVFAVDTFVSSDSPVDPQRTSRIALGSGAVLRAVDNSSITPPATLEVIRKLAAARGIPVTVGTTNGGNDGSQFSKVGTIVVPISWPGRYSHSAVEVIDGRDLQALVDLIVALAQGM